MKIYFYELIEISFDLTMHKLFYDQEIRLNYMSDDIKKITFAMSNKNYIQPGMKNIELLLKECKNDNLMDKLYNNNVEFWLFLWLKNVSYDLQIKNLQEQKEDYIGAMKLYEYDFNDEKIFIK